MFFSGLNKSSASKYMFILLAACSLPLTACDVMSNQLKHDRSGGLELQDYRDGLASRMNDDVDSSSESVSESSSIPGLQPYVAQGSHESKPMPLVSISVNQTVPLRDVLFELANQADYDLELDPRIQGSIIFTARERPFDQVIERISEIAGLRYKMDDNFLRVELDLPFQKTYKLDYLAFVRNSSSQVSNDISVVSGDGADTGSSFTATSETTNDFWTELTAGMDQIMASASTSLMITSSDPVITAAEQNPNVQAVVPPDAQGNVVVQPPQATLRVESLPVTGTGGGTGGTEGEETGGATYAVNRTAGLISVYAPESIHKKVFGYLEMVRRSMTSQVLIEAKILQVSLSDNYRTGVDWRILESLLPGPVNLTFFDDIGDFGVSPDVNSGFDPAEDGTGLLLGYSGADIDVIIRALQNFGSIRALASPRISVLNNQPAALNVATNEVFFELDIETTLQEDGTAGETEVDSTIRNVPVGVLVNVQPSINLDARTISMAIRPTITAIRNRKEDPAVAFAVASLEEAIDLTSEIPELNVQEIDTVVNMKSGQAIIMGGLLQDSSATTDDGVPVLGEVPMFGSLFKNHSDIVQKTELVIYLKATILDNPASSVHNTDKDLYRMFADDRRPLKL